MVGGHHSLDADALLRLWDEQGGLCALTGDPLVEGVNASLDHIIPISAGGSLGVENVRWVTLIVNHAKRHYADADFVTMCRKVAARFPAE